MNKSAKLMIAGLVFSIIGATPAMADLSANIGVLSDYFYRGVVQNTTATTNGITPRYTTMAHSQETSSELPLSAG